MLDFDNIDGSPDVHADVHVDGPDGSRAEDVVVQTDSDVAGPSDDVEADLTVVADPSATVQAEEDQFAKKLEDDSKL